MQIFNHRISRKVGLAGTADVATETERLIGGSALTIGENFTLAG